MNYLLDTNVVSEWTKSNPSTGVVAWLAEADEDRTFLSVITLVELRYGTERMQAGVRRKRLTDWLEEDLPSRFRGRVLSVDERVADVCGRTIALSEAAGRRIEAMDALIAATAVVHDLTLVTRNTSDFESVLGKLLNPWE